MKKPHPDCVPCDDHQPREGTTFHCSYECNEWCFFPVAVIKACQCPHKLARDEFMERVKNDGKKNA